jgi:hypothetical protein
MAGSFPFASAPVLAIENKDDFGGGVMLLVRRSGPRNGHLVASGTKCELILKFCLVLVVPGCRAPATPSGT